MSYSEPGSAEASSAEGSHSSLLDCGGLEVRAKKKKKKKKKKSAKGSEEESWKSGVRRASDCLRDVVKRCQQQLLCNDNKCKVRR